MSGPTKKYKSLMWTFKVLALICTFAPLIAFLIYGFVTGDTTTKVSMSLLSLAGIALAVVNIIFKYSFRTAIYLILLAIGLALENIQTALVTLLVASALDEFVFTPLAKHFKGQYMINKEIDKRIDK